MAGKDPVINEIKETHAAVIACLLRGRLDREEVERGARVHETDPGRVFHPGEVPPIGHLRQGDELYSEVGERDTRPLQVNWRTEHLVEKDVLGVLGGEGVTRTGVLAGKDGSGEVESRRIGDLPLPGEGGREVLMPWQEQNRVLPSKVRGDG